LIRVTSSETRCRARFRSKSRKILRVPSRLCFTLPPGSIAISFFRRSESRTPNAAASPANKRVDLEDLSGADFRKMIDEDQHVQMQHGMFVTNFEKRRMNRLLPVLHQRAHQAKRIVKLIAESRWLRCRLRGRVMPRGTMPPHHDEVTLDAIEPRNSRE
jgi:hypothetical protein